MVRYKVYVSCDFQISNPSYGSQFDEIHSDNNGISSCKFSFIKQGYFLKETSKGMIAIHSILIYCILTYDSRVGISKN